MRGVALAAALLASAAPARGELALLDNGQVLKLEGHRRDGGALVLTLAGGGELTLRADRVEALLPDELPMEAAEAAAAVVAAGPAVDLRALAVAAARRHGVDAGLVLAVVAVESAFRTDAVSAKGAQGLMQLMPATAAELGVRDAFDPAANLDGGVRHLRRLVDLYGGDLRRALAAYNAGAAAVDRHGGVPPYRETQAYVESVLARYAGAP